MASKSTSLKQTTFYSLQVPGGMPGRFGPGPIRPSGLPKVTGGLPSRPVTTKPTGPATGSGVPGAGLGGVEVLKGFGPSSVAVALGRAGLGVAARLPWFKGMLPRGVQGKALAVVPKTEIVKTGVSVATAVSVALTAEDLGKKYVWPAVKGIATEVAKTVLPGIKFGPGHIEDDSIFTTGRSVTTVAHPQAGTSLQFRPQTMGLMPDSNSIVKSWHANGIAFWRTMDGWIYVQRLDGTVKRYRPYKSVVLGKRPSSRQVNRAINKLRTEYKIYGKLVRLFQPKRSSKH